MTSAFVLNELALAPVPKSTEGVDLLASVRVLVRPPRFDEVVQTYIREGLMPAGAQGDAAHLAMASLHAVDFMLTWNCRHLANANKVDRIRATNERLGLFVPHLTTPWGLVPENEP